MRQVADVVRRANGHPATKRHVAVIASGPAPTRSGHEAGRLAREADAARQAALEAASERVPRTTLEQAVLHPRQLIRRLAAAGAPYTDRQP